MNIHNINNFETRSFWGVKSILDNYGVKYTQMSSSQEFIINLDSLLTLTGDKIKNLFMDIKNQDKNNKVIIQTL